MAYRCKIDEPFAKALRRIAREQIHRAATRLSQAHDGPTPIHEARKHLKRIRALLCLVRPALGEKAFRQENARMREIGHLLAGARDLDVLEETAAALAASCRPGLRPALREVMSSIESARRAAAADGMAERIEKARARLEEAAEAVSRLKLHGRGFDTVDGGLRRTYRDCRKWFARAYEEPTDQNFHSWRKTVQHHWRHMVLLTEAWPEAMKARAAAAKELSDILGQDHDLAMLKGYMETGIAAGLPAKTRDQLVRLCKARQARLRELARPRGERLLAERTKAFSARIESYWTHAREIAAEERSDMPQPRQTDAAAAYKTPNGAQG
jgi:CHAD domain-containing protein